MKKSSETGSDLYEQTLTQAVEASRFKSKIIIGLFVVLIISACLNVNQYRYTPVCEPIGLTADGQVIKLPTLSEPYFTPSKVSEWAASRLETAYELTINNYATWPMRLSASMTEGARKDFMSAVEDKGLVKLVIDQHYLMGAVRSAQPTVIKNWYDEKAKRYMWVVEFPLRVSLDGGQKSQAKSFNAVYRVWVGRELFNISSDGLIIGRIELHSNGVLQ